MNIMIYTHTFRRISDDFFFYFIQFNKTIFQESEFFVVVESILDGK